MHKFAALITFGFCASVFAVQNPTIVVGEEGFTIDGSAKIVDKESLLKVLKGRDIESVILAVDVCARPVQVADAYVVLGELGISEIDLRGVGTLEPGSCSDV